MYTEEKPDLETLIHYGKLGMKWGKRTARAGAWLREAGKVTSSNIRHPIITGKANKESIKTGNLSNQLKRRFVYQNTKELKDVNRRVKVMLKEKANSKSVKSKAKIGKSVTDSWLREAGKVTLSNIRHPIITNRANKESIKTGNLSNQLKRRFVYQNTNELKDVNRRIDNMLKNKK